MYGEYAERIYGFCVLVLRDRDEAADAMHDTFVLAAQRVGQLRDPERLGAWLFAVARHLCFRRLDHRQRVTPMERPPDELVLDDDAGARLSAAEAEALVWDAAGGLNERDRAVLALNVQEGLEGPELGAALGVQHANPYSLLHRAKEQLERAVSVLLVARAGRRDCPTLAQILNDWDGALTPLLRKRLGRHIDDCAACARTKSRARPFAAMAGLPLLKPVRARAFVHVNPRDISADALLERAASAPLSTERWQPDGFPPPLDEERKRRRKPLILIAVAALGAGLAITFGLGVAARQGGSKPAPAAPPTQAAPAAAVVAHARRSPMSTVAPRRVASRTTTSLAAPSPTTPTTVGTVTQQVVRVASPPPTNAPKPPRVTAPKPPPPTTVVTSPPTTAPKTTTTLPET
jgi:RNA polymerase sigma factor (sigma-70 family)